MLSKCNGQRTGAREGGVGAVGEVFETTAGIVFKIVLIFYEGDTRKKRWDSVDSEKEAI